MKILAIALLLASLQSDTTALVDASKENKSKRKKSTSRVITNKDVKKSKGKVIQLGEQKPIEGEGQQTSLEKQEAERKLRLETDARAAALDTEVAALSAELARIEQSYFDENDPAVRDTAIVKRFNETKAKLDAARAELATLRPSP